MLLWRPAFRQGCGRVGRSETGSAVHGRVGCHGLGTSTMDCHVGRGLGDKIQQSIVGCHSLCCLVDLLLDFSDEVELVAREVTRQALLSNDSELSPRWPRYSGG